MGSIIKYIETAAVLSYAEDSPTVLSFGKLVDESGFIFYGNPMKFLFYQTSMSLCNV